MTDDRGELLRPKEVANLFRVHPATVRKWAREGKLETRKTLGGHVRFLRAEVERVLRELGIPGETPP